MKHFNTILSIIMLFASMSLFRVDAVFADSLDLDNVVDIATDKQVDILEKTILLRNDLLKKEWFVKVKDLGLQDDLSLDIDIATLALKKLNDDLPQPVEGYFSYDKKVLSLNPSQLGYQIDVEKTLKNIELNFENLAFKEIQVVVKEYLPEVNEVDLEKYKDILGQKLKNITIFYKEKKWDLLPEQYVPWISIKPKQNLVCAFLDNKYEIKTATKINMNGCEITEDLEIFIKTGVFEDFIEQNVKKNIEISPQNVKIYYDKNDKIVFEGTATNGRQIIMVPLSKLLAKALENGIPEFELPVKEILGQVEADEKLKSLGIKELVAVGYSNFSGSSQARIYNVNFGISKYNGLMVAPGEKFSFNEHLGGPVTNEAGWKSELVIKGNKTVPEAGGGLCQVSSTFYRAAFYGGYEINERSGHSYAVSYYANPHYGMDCTVYPGVKDCIFTNDSDFNILIQTYTEGVDAYFKFYSTSDGRKVELEGPYYYGYNSASPVSETSSALQPGQKKITENAHTGFSVDWYRTVIKDGVRGAKKYFHTKYRAVPAKYLVGAEAVTTNESEAVAQ